jgi:hypothetical protein
MLSSTRMPAAVSILFTTPAMGAPSADTPEAAVSTSAIPSHTTMSKRS